MNRALVPLLLLACAAAALAALCLGTISLSPLRIPALLFARDATGDPTTTALLELRLPRVLLALLIGAALAQCGAVTQALFRNPLAEPGLLGVSAGAALAAALMLTVFAGSAGAPALLPVAAFAGAAVVTAAVLALVRDDRGTDLTALLLAGAAINAFVSAGVGLIATLADDGALRSFTLWMFGNLGRADWHEIAIAGPLLLAVVLWLPMEAPALDALLLGETEAAHLGFAVERRKRRLLLLVVLATACAVALAGLIGFVGLIVPHAIRLLVGPGHRLLLPASALLGAALLTATDAVARAAHPPLELPVGVLTALLGAPCFLALLIRGRGTPP